MQSQEGCQKPNLWSPLNEQNNSRKEPAKEDITNNSFELLQIVKDLKTKMETVKK